MTPFGLLCLFVGAFAIWVLTLALIWRAFRSWQYLVDLGSLQNPHDAKAAAIPWEDLPRLDQMALRAQIVVSGLPDGATPAMAPYARRFRVSVLAVVALSCVVGLAVSVFEPALAGAVRVFLIGVGAWAVFHIALLAVWRLRGPRIGVAKS